MEKAPSRFGPERRAALKLLSLTCGLGLLTLWRLDWRTHALWFGGVGLGWGWALGALVFPALGRPWVKVFAGLESAFRFTVTALSLGLAFFAVVTPLAWAGKLFGKGFLGAKSGAGRTGEGPDSYWKERKSSRAFSATDKASKTEAPGWDKPY